MTKVRVHICDVCDVEYDELTRACSDTWRELAAVAGLALWADRVLWPGSESPQDVTDCEPWDCERLRPLLGWEAPDA